MVGDGDTYTKKSHDGDDFESFWELVLRVGSVGCEGDEAVDGAAFLLDEQGVHHNGAY